MSVVTIKSTAIANLGAPESLINARNDGRVVGKLDSAVMGSNNTVGDVYLLLPVRSNACLASLKLFNDDLDGNGSPTLTLDIGIANGPDKFVDGATAYAAYAPISAQLFAAGTAVAQSAVILGTELAGKVASHASEMLQPLWQRAGLAADPDKLFVVQVKIAVVSATAVPAGTIVLKADVLGAN